MPMTEEKIAVLENAIRSGELQGEDLQLAAQTIADYRNVGNQESVTPTTDPAQMTEQELGRYIGDQFKSMRAKGAVAVVSALGGAGEAAHEFGQAVFDIGANITGWGALERKANAIQQTQQNLHQATQEVGAEVASRILGRPVQVNEITDLAGSNQEIGRVLTQAGLMAGGGASTARLATGVITTAPRALAFGATDGAFWGWFGSNSDAGSLQQRVDERLGQAELGVVLGASANIIPSALMGAKNWLGRKLTSILESGAADNFRLADEFGVDISWGMASGSPTIQKMEADAAGDIAQEFLANQGDDVSKAIGQRLGIDVQPVEQAGAGFYRRMENVFEAFEKRLGMLRKIKNSAWDANMQAARDMAGDSKLFVPFRFRQGINDVMSDMEGRAMHDIPWSAEFKNLMRDVDEASKAGGATINQLDRWWKTVNRWKSADSGLLDAANPFSQGVKGQQQVLAGDLARTLKDSFGEAAVARQGTDAGRAIQKLISARDQYVLDSKNIQALENQFGQAFGTSAGDPVALINKLGNADPAIIRRAAQAMKKVDGGEMVLEQIKRGIFEAARQAGAAKAATNPSMAGVIDVEAFTKAFSANSKRSALAGLLTPEEEKTAVEGINLLRNVLNGQTRAARGVVQKATLPIGLQEVAINAISRDPGFIARLAAGAVQRGSTLEKLMFTPEGINYLKRLQPKNAKDLGKWSIGRNTAIIGLAEALKTGSISDFMENK